MLSLDQEGEATVANGSNLEPSAKKDADGELKQHAEGADAKKLADQSAAEQDEMIKYIALAINSALVVCKTVALIVCGKYAICQSLFDSVGDVLGNIAVIIFREEIGVLLQAIVMGLASIGVIIPAGISLLVLAGILSEASHGTEDPDRFTAILLCVVAIVTKGLVYVFCRVLARSRNCGIAVQAIRGDAANDVIMNSGALVCAFPEFGVALLGGRLLKSLEIYVVKGMDPGWAFGMSIPILHGWIETGREQIAALQDNLAPDHVKNE